MNLSVADETSLQSPIKELFVEDPARSRDWTSIALESARSLVFLDDDHCTVLRKASERPTKSDRFFCPTATCQVMAAFIECGVEFAGPYDINAPSQVQEVILETTSEVKLSPRFPRGPHYGRFVFLLLDGKCAPEVTAKLQRNWISTPTKKTLGIVAAPPVWLCAALYSSRHFDIKNNNPSLREVILYSNLLRSLQGSWKHLAQAQKDKIAGDISDATLAIIFRVYDVLIGAGMKGKESASSRTPQPPLSSYLMLHAAYCLVSATRLLQDLDYRKMDTGLSRTMARIREHLIEHFDGQSHRLMAKRWAGDDFQYDVVSLGCALAGWDLLDETVRKTPFFASVVSAMARDQLANGCWPDGASVVVTAGGETIQLPSVEMALCLARAAFRRDYLVDAGPADVALMQLAYPALRQHGRYLASSRQTIDYGEGKRFSGWTSDRTRILGDAETWCTTAAAMVFHNTYLIERALRREKILQKYGASRPRNLGPIQTGPKVSICGFWDKSVIEPEQISRPLSVIRKLFLETIESEERRERAIVKLLSDGVSILIFGPPGSGKTHLISTLSKTTGWPLIELNPGNFIERGLELIEAVAGQVFRDLCSLEHAIVFFDECDELFKSRDQQDQEGQPRNIASFVTAAMLPKLQKLHDERRVIFVVATNLLQSIDYAIRRPGRFDNVLLLDRPHTHARRAFIKGSKRKQLDEDGTLDRLVDASSGLTFPEILSMIRDFPNIPSEDKLNKMRADYVRWCQEKWDREATVAGLTPQQIAKIAESRVKTAKEET